MYQQKGFAHLILLVVVFVVAIVAIVLVSVGVIKLPSSLKNLVSKNTETSVEVKTEYKNPFAKESQYINPFDQYKSPFLTLKEK